MNEGSLSTKRFIVNPESQKLLEEARNEFFKLREKYPELGGMAFLGSLTVGREKPGSDRDCVLFSESSKNFPHHMSRESEIVKKIKAELNSVQTKEKVRTPYSLIGVVNISEEATDKDIVDFIELVKSNEKGDIRKPPVASIVPRFLLGIGEGLYKNRKYVLDKLAQEENGDEIWQNIVGYLQYVERIGETKKRSSLPAYENYPKTIAEARGFFINKTTN